MRMLALVPDAFGGYGGIARYVRDFLGALAATEAVEDVVVLPRMSPGATGPLPPKVTQLAPVHSRVLYSLRALSLAVFGAPVDAVFCGHLYMAPLAAIVARLVGAPLWIAVYGIEAWESPGPWVKWAIRRALLVTAISRYTRGRLLEWAAIPQHRVRVLPNTIGSAFVAGPPPSGLVERFKGGGGKVLLTVSRLSPSERYKGIGRVFEVLPQLISRFQKITYVIVGDGDDREHLVSLAERKGLLRHVHFAGKVTDEELAGYYRLADVFVMPSTKEGFGFVFLEAAAAGTPVIGCNADGSVDALADGMIGACIPPNDSDALVSAIASALLTARPSPERVTRFRLDNFRHHLSRLVDGLATS